MREHEKRTPSAMWRKAAKVAPTRPDAVTTAKPSSLLQIRRYLAPTSRYCTCRKSSTACLRGLDQVQACDAIDGPYGDYGDPDGYTRVGHAGQAAGHRRQVVMPATAIEP